ncbi:MAG: leucine-rich repeat domain-containing protein [Chlamydiales bacterium]|nr:leucine-rich repeat domain-containing protein [Chlamydiales bacterium]
MTIVRWSTSAMPCNFSGLKDAFGTGVGSMLTVHELGLVARVCTFFRDQVNRRTLAVAALEIQQVSAPLAEKVNADYAAAFWGDERLPTEIVVTAGDGCNTFVLGMRATATGAALLNSLKECWQKAALLSAAPKDSLAEKRWILFYGGLTKLLDACPVKKEEEWALNPEWETARRAELHESGLPAVTIDTRIETQRGELATIAAVQNENLGRAMRALQEFFTREKLTDSFNRVFAYSIIPEDEKWSRWAGEVFAFARETALGRTQVRALIETNRPLPETLLGVHRIVDETEHERARSLLSLGDALAGLGFVAPAGVRNIGRWLESEEERPHLEQIEGLALNNSSDIPRAIGRFQGLTTLQFTGPIAYLPDELASLPNLKRLRFFQSNFSALPDILQRIPALTELAILNNRLPIRELPEGLACKLHTSRLGMMCSAAWQGFHGGFFEIEEFERYEHQKYFGLDRRELTNIPFYLWFEETFSLPYISMEWAFYPFQLLADVFDIHNRDLGEAAIPLFLFALGASAFLLALDLAFFIYNLLLNLAIEPIVTFFRDRLGYTRMVALA